MILYTEVQQNLPAGFRDPRQPKQFKNSANTLSVQWTKKPTEEPFSSYYKASRDIDAFVKTERTNGASSPGCIVVGTIV